MEVKCYICNKIFKKRCNYKSKNHFCSLGCFKKKVYTKKQVPSHCFLCNKERTFYDKKSSKDLCRSCLRKERLKNDPKFKEKERLQGFLRSRKLRGKPLDAPIKKAKNGNGHIARDGYKKITIKNHPFFPTGRITEHVFIMSEYIGRPLMKNETVHHKNGIRTDNRIENLELWNRKHGPGQRVKDRILYYKEFIEQYGGKVDLSAIVKIFDD